MTRFLNKFHFFTFILAVSFLFANPPFDQDGDGQFDDLNQFEFDGKKYSRSMLNYLNGLVCLKQTIDTDQIKNILLMKLIRSKLIIYCM